MRNFTAISMTVALISGAVSFGADAAVSRSGLDLSQFRYRHESSSAFVDSRSHRINEANAMMHAKTGMAKSKYYDANPSVMSTLGPKVIVGTIDGPNGEEWYYTADLDYLEIPPHDEIQFTDRILQSYCFYIYDAEMRLVGSIKDKMSYREDEVRAVSCDLVPFISRNFFNTDDKWEVVVGLSINAAQLGVNHYRSCVYQLGGEKVDGNDKIVQTVESLIGDVSEAPSDDGSENFYITYLQDVEGNIEDGASYWDYLTSVGIKASVMKKAGSTGEPTLFYERIFPICRMQGDQQNTPFMFTVVNGNDLYYVMPAYAEPFYNEYNDPVNDETTMRTPNALNVDFLKVEPDGLKLQYTTTIPVVKADNEKSPASYFAVGNFRYRDDVKFTGYPTTEGRAALFVTRQDYLSSSDSYIYSYYIYDDKGQLLHTLFENADSSVPMSDIEGFEPQEMFIYSDEFGYDFSFVNLVSGKRVLKFSSQFELDEDSDPEALTANIDRFQDADGSYVYVDEMRVPEVVYSEPDATGKTEEIDNLMRFIWINKDGSFRKIDKVSMGKNVRYAQSLINADVLNPNIFHSDDNQEYMMLIKRATNTEENVEELLIGQAINDNLPEGNTLLLLGPEERGILKGIIPDVYSSKPKLTVTYADLNTGTYTMDFYALPLDSNPLGGVSKPEIVEPSNGGIIVISNIVMAEGRISVYNAAGALVAAGTDRVDLDGLAAGVYIASCQAGACKVLVK